MPRKLNLFDALVNRRKTLVKQLSKDSIRNNPKKLNRVAHELRELSKRLEGYDEGVKKELDKLPLPDGKGKSTK